MRDESGYLRDIVDAVEAIRKCMTGVSKESFLADDVLQGNVSFRLLAIGEAANKVSDDFCKWHPQIEWPKIVALRNMIVHSYFALKWDLIYNIATIDAPTLGAQVEHILKEEFPEPEE